MADILIVDDDALTTRLMSGLLGQDGHTTRTAADGRAGLAAAVANPPDLVILDITMPELDGYEVCRRLKRNPATEPIPVIFVTARDDAADQTLGFDLGASDYVTKPYDRAVVLARVRHQLRLKQAFDRMRAASAIARREGANQFRKSGQGWTVRFQSAPPILLRDSKGAAYIALLLTHPNRHFSVEEAAYSISGEEALLAVGSAGPALDEQAIAQYRVRVEALLDRKDEAQHNRDSGAEDAAQAEIDWIVGELKRTGLLDRRVRQAASDRERLRKSIGNAVRRTLSDIAEADPALAMHLTFPRLRLGTHLVYEPNDDIAWDT